MNNHRLVAYYTPQDLQSLAQQNHSEHSQMMNIYSYLSDNFSSSSDKELSQSFQDILKFADKSMNSKISKQKQMHVQQSSFLKESGILEQNKQSNPNQIKSETSQNFFNQKDSMEESFDQKALYAQLSVAFSKYKSEQLTAKLKNKLLKLKLKELQQGDAPVHKEDLEISKDQDELQKIYQANQEILALTFKYKAKKYKYLCKNYDKILNRMRQLDKHITVYVPEE